MQTNQIMLPRTEAKPKLLVNHDRLQIPEAKQNLLVNHNLPRYCLPMVPKEKRTVLINRKANLLYKLQL